MRLSAPIGFFAPHLLAPLLALSAEPAPDSLEAPWDAGAKVPSAWASTATSTTPATPCSGR